jgi:hypothetical protein
MKKYEALMMAVNNVSNLEDDIEFILLSNLVPEFFLFFIFAKKRKTFFFYFQPQKKMKIVLKGSS